MVVHELYYACACMVAQVYNYITECKVAT